MEWMDVFRGLAIIMVIFHHSVWMLHWRGQGIQSTFTALDSIMEPYRMPGLILIAGMLVDRSIAKGAGTYFRGKLAGVVWPLAVWGALLPLIMWQAFTVKDLHAIVTPSHSTLWYLWFLAVFYPLIYVLRKVNPLVIALFAASLATVAPEWYKLDRFLQLFAFFAIGVFLSRHSATWMGWLTSRTGTVAVFAVASAVSFESLTTANLKYDPFMIAWICVGMGAIVRLCMWATRYPWINKPLQFSGKNSIIFYILHWPVVYFGYPLLVSAGITRSIFLIPLLFAAALLVPWGVSVLASRFPVVHWLFRFPLKSDRLTSMGTRTRYAGAGAEHGMPREASKPLS